MTQKQKNILFFVLPIICAVIALSSVIGVGVAISKVEDIKEIVETRLPEMTEQLVPVETEQAIPAPTDTPSPEPPLENHTQTKPTVTENMKQESAAEPVRKQEAPKTEVKQEITVYVTKYGECYHDDRNCYHIRKSEVTALSLSEAKKLYRPCSHCAE